MVSRESRCNSSNCPETWTWTFADNVCDICSGSDDCRLAKTCVGHLHWMLFCWKVLDQNISALLLTNALLMTPGCPTKSLSDYRKLAATPSQLETDRNTGTESFLTIQDSYTGALSGWFQADLLPKYFGLFLTSQHTFAKCFLGKPSFVKKKIFCEITS